MSRTMVWVRNELFCDRIASREGMKYIKSTYNVLTLYVQNRFADESWAIWALEMLEAGFETEHLVIMAGIGKSENFFYVRDLATKVFAELSLNYSSQEKIMNDYALYLVEEALAGNRSYSAVVTELKDVYNAFGHPNHLSEFYLLYWASEDLKIDKVQWYWPDATRENIQEIMSEYFREWVKDRHYESQLVG
jgi:hypothetical protein